MIKKVEWCFHQAVGYYEYHFIGSFYECLKRSEYFSPEILDHALSGGIRKAS